MPAVLNNESAIWQNHFCFDTWKFGCLGIEMLHHPEVHTLLYLVLDQWQFCDSVSSSLAVDILKTVQKILHIKSHITLNLQKIYFKLKSGY